MEEYGEGDKGKAIAVVVVESDPYTEVQVGVEMDAVDQVDIHLVQSQADIVHVAAGIEAVFDLDFSAVSGEVALLGENTRSKPRGTG